MYIAAIASHTFKATNITNIICVKNTLPFLQPVDVLKRFSPTGSRIDFARLDSSKMEDRLYLEKNMRPKQ